MKFQSSSAYKHVEKPATDLAQQLGAEYWAVSSRTGDGVKELFLRIAALAFDVSVLRDLNTPAKLVSIGTDLVCKFPFLTTLKNMFQLNNINKQQKFLFSFKKTNCD